MTKIRISLLPDELKKQSSLIKRWTLLALVLTILALILLAGNILLSLYVEVPVNDLNSLKNQNRNLTENIGRISYIQDMFDSIEFNNRLIKELKGVNPDWSFSIRESIADITLYGISVDKIEITTAGQTPGCVITAWTNSISNISIWSDQALERDNISHVNINDIKPVSDADNNLNFYFYAEVGLKSWNDGEGEQ